MLKQTLLTLLLVSVSLAFVIYDTRFGNASIADSVKNALDLATSPCDDFYQYACGGWLKNTSIPQESARYSRSFDVINRRNFEVLKNVLESDAPVDPSLRKFFSTCMGTQAIEQEGTGVLDSYLSIVDQLVEDPRTGSWENVWKFAGFLHTIRMTPFFEFHVEVDAKEPKNYLAQLGQAGIMMPDRSYYLEESEADTRAQYKVHITKMFTMLNVSNPEQRANDILNLEIALARIFVPGADLRDPFKTYNKKTTAELKQLAPSINWDAFKQAAYLSDNDNFNVAAPVYFENLSGLLEQFTLPQVSSYFKWILTHESSDYLPSRFRNETFAFFGKVLDGKKEQAPRSTQCIESTDESMGFLLSQYFVEREFSGESKTIALNMVHTIEDTFRDTLKKDDWLDEVTRERALNKLSLVGDMIGYPNPWPTYNFTVSSSYIRNKLAARSDSYIKMKDKLKKPVSHTDWEMTPETVNAYYEPTLNVMVFPAAILQNPFFDKSFPTVMNYGGAGMVMGHELSHGFDDQGRLYDGYGKLENWWTPEVSNRFADKAQCLVKQYSNFEILPGYFINGNLTLGENIADCGLF
jgi:putative endopeptidase